jgi:hypothetical protein
LLVAVWFASGFAMMFVTFPRLSDAERVAGSEAIDARALSIPVALRDALARGDFPIGVRVRITTIDGRPVLIARDGEGETHLWPAREGDATAPFDATRIRSMAERRFRRRVSAIDRHVDPDQWTVPGSLSACLPLYRVSLDDPEHTELYFTEDTGELVQRTTREERVLAWLGPIPHWIYPTMLRRDRGTWRTVVLTLTCIGLVVAASGLVSGVRVWAKLRRRGPGGIRDRWLRLHQAIGLVLAIPALTWLASGAFSLSPFGRFAGPVPSEAVLRAVYGALVLPPDDVLRDAIARCAGEGSIHEAELFAFIGEPHLECTREDATRTTYTTSSSISIITTAIRSVPWCGSRSPTRTKPRCTSMHDAASSSHSTRARHASIDGSTKASIDGIRAGSGVMSACATASSARRCCSVWCSLVSGSRWRFVDRPVDCGSRARIVRGMIRPPHAVPPRTDLSLKDEARIFMA